MDPGGQAPGTEGGRAEWRTCTGRVVQVGRVSLGEGVPEKGKAGLGLMEDRTQPGTHRHTDEKGRGGPQGPGASGGKGRWEKRSAARQGCRRLRNCSDTPEACCWEVNSLRRHPPRVWSVAVT